MEELELVETLDEKPIDETLDKRLKAFGAYSNRFASQQERMQTTSEEVREKLQGYDIDHRPDNGFQTNSESIQYYLGELVDVQRQIDRKISAEQSRSRRFTERALSVFALQSQMRSIDDLFEDQLRTIAHMKGALDDSLSYSSQVLNEIIDYRDNDVLPTFTGALRKHMTTENRLKAAMSLFEETTEELQETKVTDSSYMQLEIAHSNLRREMKYLDNELSQQNQTIVFKQTEKDLLTQYEDLVTFGTLVISRLNNYVGNVVTHLKKTQPMYKFFRESYADMSAVFTSFEELSRVVLTGADEMGRAIGHMAEMSRETSYDNFLPSQLGAQIVGYKQKMLDMDARSREHFDSRAIDIKEGYGLPAPNQRLAALE